MKITCSIFFFFLQFLVYNECTCVQIPYSQSVSNAHTPPPPSPTHKQTPTHPNTHIHGYTHTDSQTHVHPPLVDTMTS